MTEEKKPMLEDYRVVWKHQVGEGLWDICIATASGMVKALKPGMFVNVAVPGDPSHILRIPMSFYRTDPVRGWICMVVAERGEGTRRLCALEPGEGDTVLGPLGHGWKLPAEGAKRALLVAGGVGAPPVYAAARMCMKAGIDCDVIFGAKTENHYWHEGAQALMGMDGGEGYESVHHDGGAAEVFAATDDGSEGFHGTAVDLMAEMLPKRSYDVVYSCGPEPMMGGVAKLAQEWHIPCQVSMERMMTCGFGACGTCNVKMANGGYKSCCMDGPIFDAEEVSWQ